MTNLTNLQHEAKKIALSEQEKAFMRSQIFGLPAQAGDTPASQVPVPSYVVSNFQFFSVRFMPALAAILIVMLGAGTTYAAQAALPGDLLYTIKVGVNEPVREALAVSAESKVAFHTEVAETRLEEAEALAAEGRLSADTSDQIETSFETHLARAEEITMELEEGDKDTSADISAQLDSVLAAHGSILATLGEESDDEETKEHSNRFASRLAMRTSVRGNAEAMNTMSLKVAVPEVADFALMATEDASTSAETEASITMQASDDSARSASNSSSSEATKQAAEQLEEKAEEALEESRDKFEDIQSSLDATTSARVIAQFKTLESQLVEGQAMYEAEEYVGARANFNAVLSDASALSAYLRAEKRFSRNLLRSWIDDRFGRILEVNMESETEFEHESEVKGGSINQDDDNDGSDGKDGADGQDGEDGKSGSTQKGTSSSSASVKVNIDLGL